MEGARFTQEQIEQAKNTSMTELARYMGYTPVRIGKYMALKEMDSIRIYDDKSWYRWSDKTGGTPVDFLLKFGNYTFREAVETLLNLQGVRTEFVGKEIQVMQSKQSERMEFHLPEPADNFKRMFAYLMKTRNLSYEVVSYFVKKKLLYEEKEHHTGRSGSGDGGSFHRCGSRFPQHHRAEKAGADGYHCGPGCGERSGEKTALDGEQLLVK